MSIDISNTFEKCAPTPQFTQSNAPHSLLNCSFAVGLLRNDLVSLVTLIDKSLNSI